MASELLTMDGVMAITTSLTTGVTLCLLVTALHGSKDMFANNCAATNVLVASRSHALLPISHLFSVAGIPAQLIRLQNFEMSRVPPTLRAIAL